MAKRSKISPIDVDALITATIALGLSNPVLELSVFEKYIYIYQDINIYIQCHVIINMYLL